MYVCFTFFFVMCYFFFFKQKTAYEMRISDWSSDVCSSDLNFAFRFGPACRYGRGMTDLHLHPSLREPAQTSKAWPFEEARKLVKRYPEGKPGGEAAIFETGYGPSEIGRAHV